MSYKKVRDLMAFSFMDFLLVWTILAGTNVIHISGIGFTSISRAEFSRTTLYLEGFESEIASRAEMVLYPFFLPFYDRQKNRHVFFAVHLPWECSISCPILSTLAA